MATAQPRPTATAASEGSASGAAASTRPSFSVLLLGDTMLGRLVDEQLRALQLRGEGPERVWGDMLPLAEAADVCLLNLECAITDHPVRRDAVRRRAWIPRLMACFPRFNRCLGLQRRRRFTSAARRRARCLCSAPQVCMPCRWQTTTCWTSTCLACTRR